MESLKGQIATNWRFGTKQSSPKARKVGSEAGPDVEGSTANADNPEHSTANLDREGFFEVKRSLHRTVLSRMDLAAAETMAPDRLRQNLAELIDLFIVEKSLPVNEAERIRLVRDLQNVIMGLGPIEPLLADPNISEIMVNGPQRVFVEQAGRVQLTDIRFNDTAHLMKIIDKIVSRVGRRIDESNPMADARLPDGSRVNAIVPPLSLDGPALTIRRFATVPLQMQDLIEYGAHTSNMAELLAGLVRAKANILISGGTSSGKTTLLNILSSYIPENERIVTIEDTAELQLQQSHVVRLETRAPNIEGAGGIPMRALVKNALRMRPDRIVLGEVRGGEVIDMLQAMNTGHDGSLTTIHANTPRDAMSRMENLVGMGGLSLPARALRQQISSALNVILQASRLTDGSRKIISIHEITGIENDVITSQEIFTYDRVTTTSDGIVQGHFKPTGVRPMFSDRLARYGIHLSPEMFEPVSD